MQFEHHIKVRISNGVGFYRFRSLEVESIKNIGLHITSAIGMWIKAVKEKTKNVSYEHSQM